MHLSPLNSRRPASQKTGLSNALSMIEGHHRFLKRNTGDTDDGSVQHLVQNNQGVLSNNRHFIAHTQMEYQPNGDGTTEGQALHVLGYAHAYLATKNPAYLEAAVWHWQAYVDYFYAGQPIPDTPSRWIANWIINSKEPCLSNWPINPAAPTQGGYKCVPLRFVNGQAQIPHGSPFWGEYLDVLTMAHRGHMTWDSINGSVQVINNDIDWDQVLAHRNETMPSTPWSSLAWVDWDAYLGKGVYDVDWNKKGKEYAASWINVWTGNKIGIGRGPNDQLWNGDIIETGIPAADVGRVQLADSTINGVYFVNYAVRLPLELGGYLFKRNEVWHNRPIHTPLLGTANQRGNAADGEEWFMDACYMLWRITGHEHYKKAMDACFFTALEYTNIDSADKFFRQDTTAHTPFTDGISYDFTYPSDVPITYGRDQDGYIAIYTQQAVDLSLEQQAVWFRVGQKSSIRVTYSGVGHEGGAVSASPRLIISMDKQEEGGLVWKASLPDSEGDAIKTVDVPLNQFVQSTKADGSEYILADLRAVVSADSIVSKSVYIEGLLDGRNAKVVESFFPDDDGWYSIGNYLQPGGVAPIESITYKADADFNLRLEDDDKWRWWWMLPATNGEWVTKIISKSDATLSSYQPNRNDRPLPSVPVYTVVEEVSVLFDDSSTVNATFAYYCLNEIPPRYTQDDGYTMNFRITLGCSDSTGFSGRLGDCQVVDYRDDNLAYTPGLIPFSNIYEEGTDQIGAWRGMPYPGYQYPFIYTLEPEKYSRHLGNMTDFLYDSQQWYFTKFGQLGPGASAYVWNRWDNYKYGPPDTFTIHHWGDGNAWSGYQPRAMMGACRAWYELANKGKAVPPKLITYAENWLTWLVTFTKASGGVLPTDFPMTGVPQPDPDDFTGHVTGLWLAGACLAALAGSKVAGLDYLIEACVTELQNNYVVTSVPGHAMNGSWSPAVRVGTDNGMFFGFWAGEILRGLGLYIQYRNLGAGADIYSGIGPL